MGITTGATGDTSGYEESFDECVCGHCPACRRSLREEFSRAPARPVTLSPRVLQILNEDPNEKPEPKKQVKPKPKPKVKREPKPKPEPFKREPIEADLEIKTSPPDIRLRVELPPPPEPEPVEVELPKRERKTPRRRPSSEWKRRSDSRYHLLTDEERKALHAQHNRTTREKMLAERYKVDGKWFHPRAEHGTIQGSRYYQCGCRPCADALNEHRRLVKEKKRRNG